MSNNLVSVRKLVSILEQKGFLLLGEPFVEVYKTMKGEQAIFFLTYETHGIHVTLLETVLKPTPITTGDIVESYRNRGIQDPEVLTWEQFLKQYIDRYISFPTLEVLQKMKPYTSVTGIRISLGEKILEEELGVMFQTNLKETTKYFKKLMLATGAGNVEHCLYLCKADISNFELIGDYMKIPYEWLLDSVSLDAKKYTLITVPYFKHEPVSSVRRMLPIV